MLTLVEPLKLVMVDAQNSVILRQPPVSMEPFPYATVSRLIDAAIKQEAVAPEQSVYQAFPGELALRLEGLIALNQRFAEVVG